MKKNSKVSIISSHSTKVIKNSKQVKESSVLCIPAMRINRLYIPQRNPQPECDHVTRHHGWPKERWNPEDQNLSPMRIRCCISDWSCVFMVNSMNLFISPFVMQKPVDPVIGIILYQKIY